MVLCIHLSFKLRTEQSEQNPKTELKMVEYSINFFVRFGVYTVYIFPFKFNNRFSFCAFTLFIILS